MVTVITFIALSVIFCENIAFVAQVRFTFTASPLKGFVLSKDGKLGF